MKRVVQPSYHDSNNVFTMWFKYHSAGDMIRSYCLWFKHIEGGLRTSSSPRPWSLSDYCSKHLSLLTPAWIVMLSIQTGAKCRSHEQAVDKAISNIISLLHMGNKNSNTMNVDTDERRSSTESVLTCKDLSPLYSWRVEQALVDAHIDHWFAASVCAIAGRECLWSLKSLQNNMCKLGSFPKDCSHRCAIHIVLRVILSKSPYFYLYL